MPAIQCSYRSHANHPEADKSTAVADALEHLRIVKMEREHYQTICKECKQSVHALFVTSDQFTPPSPSSRNPCNSKAIQVALLVRLCPAHRCTINLIPCSWPHILTHTSEVCSVRGNLQNLATANNFVTDEAGDCGKGANTVISHIVYFTNHGFAEKDVYDGRSKGTTSFVKKSTIREGTVAIGKKVKVAWGKAKKSYNAEVLSAGSIPPAQEHLKEELLLKKSHLLWNWQLQLLMRQCLYGRTHNLFPVQISRTRRLRALLTVSGIEAHRQSRLQATYYNASIL